MSTNLEVNNQKLLQKLLRGMELSQGKFRLFLACCNNLSQRQRLIQQLQSSFSGNLAELQLDESVKELYRTISQQLGDQQPDAFMVWGLESVADIDKLLVSMSLVLDEFRKNFHFPIVLWIDQEVSRKFIRLIPDFENRTSLTVFETPTQELIDFIQQTSESVYQKVLESGAGIFLDYSDLGLVESTYQELLDARQELTNRGINLEQELEASLEFVLGRAANNYEEIALEHYQRSIQLWQELNNPLRVAHTNYYLGLWWRFYAVRHKAEKKMACEKACSYFQQLIEGFETINRSDLVAKFINAWGEVLQTLERWDELATVANSAIKVLDIPQNRSVGGVGSMGGKSVFINATSVSSRPSTTPQTSPSPQTSHTQDISGDRSSSFRLARAYNFLAEVELAKSNYKRAKKLAQTAIEICNKTLIAASPPTSEKDKIILDWEKYSRLGIYLFYLAKAEKCLGKIQSAIAIFEQAKNTTKPKYNPEFYINILRELRESYYQQKEYLKAFELKQERQQIEQQFRFIAFVGANRLTDIKLNINPALPQSKQRIKQQKFTQEIVASGRQFDVEKLLERISRRDYKLIVIHGQSGVGKSSILEAGLVPTLKEKSIDSRNVVVVLQQVYVNWISELGKILAEKLQIIANLTVNSESINSDEAIFTQLRKNDELNLLTVIIFDQFEEFFFKNSQPKDKKEFAQFLQNCLEIPFVKVVLSLREDYIHYLLEFNRLGNLEAINDDILKKNILYYLGNFKPKQAKLVIEELTANSQFKIDSELTEKLVEDLAEELGEIRPIELQVVGAQLQTENITTLAKYLELGENPKTKLVEQYLESVVKDCGKENEQLAWLVLMLLTDENNTRPLKTKAELVKEIELNVENLQLVINIFVGSRLVFLLPEKPADRYQLVHDYLVGFIRQKKGSEVFEELKLEKQKRQLAEAKQLKLQKKLFIGSVAASLVMAVLVGGMTIFAFRERRENRRAEKQTIIAQVNEVKAFSASANTLLVANKELDALIQIVRAARKLQEMTLEKVDENTQMRVITTLQQYIYRVKQRNSLERHTDKVFSISFSPDGKILASASADNTIKLWSLDGKLLRTLTGHTDRVFSVSFSPDGKTIASGSQDQTIKLWGLDGTLLKSIKAHNDIIYRANFSPDGKLIASASRDQTIKLWRLDGTLLKSIKAHNDEIKSVSFSPDGKLIASASGDQTIKLWRLDGTLVETITGHSDTVYEATFSPDGKLIASASGDETIKLWRLDGSLQKTILGHTDRVNSVSFSPDGQRIISASWDRTIKLWSLDGTLLETFNSHIDRIYNVKFSPNGKIIASSSRDSTIKLWQNNNIPRLKGHTDAVLSVTFSPNDRIIATGSADHTIRLWDRNGNLIQTFQGHTAPVFEVSFSPDGQTIASASGDKTIKLWHLNGSLIHTLTGHSDIVSSVIFSPDGQMIVSASEDNTIKFWHPNGTEIGTLIGHKSPISQVSFRPDGKIIASVSDDKTVKLWKLNGDAIKTLEKHLDHVYTVNFSPNGQVIASASRDNTIKLWDSDYKNINTLKGHTRAVSRVDFSSDGKFLASSSWDGTVKLWGSDGREIRSLQGHSDRVRSVSFSNDRKLLVSASNDNTVILWHLDLEILLMHSCNWLNDYLENRPNLPEEVDQKLCNTSK